MFDYKTTWLLPHQTRTRFSGRSWAGRLFHAIAEVAEKGIRIQTVTSTSIGPQGRQTAFMALDGPNGDCRIVRLLHYPTQNSVTVWQFKREDGRERYEVAASSTDLIRAVLDKYARMHPRKFHGTVTLIEPLPLQMETGWFNFSRFKELPRWVHTFQNISALTFPADGLHRRPVIEDEYTINYDVHYSDIREFGLYLRNGSHTVWSGCLTKITSGNNCAVFLSRGKKAPKDHTAPSNMRWPCRTRRS